MPVTLEIEGRQLETINASVGANTSGVGLVRAIHAGRTDRARHGARRHRCARRRQRVSFRDHAEPSGVGADHRQRRVDRLQLLPVTRAGDRQRPRPSRSKASRRRGSPPARCRETNVVVLNDAAVPAGLRRRCAEAVRRSAAADCSSRSAIAARGRRTEADLLPGKLGAVVDRTSGRGATLGWRDLQPSRVRDLQRPAQRRLLSRARLPVSHAGSGARGPRAGAFRRWRGGRGRTAGRHRTGDRLDDHARQYLDRLTADAGLPAARASADEVPGATTSAPPSGRPSARWSTCRRCSRGAPIAS